MKHAKQSNVPIVIDGVSKKDEYGLDGLFLVTNSLDLVSGYPLAVLTPNVNEYKHLVQKVLSCEVNDRDAPELLQSLAKRIGGVTILQKGKSDLISNGDIVKSVSIYGSPRRCGAQGDILSGSAMNPTVLGCIAASALLRKAASSSAWGEVWRIFCLLVNIVHHQKAEPSPFHRDFTPVDTAFSSHVFSLLEVWRIFHLPVTTVDLVTTQAFFQREILPMDRTLASVYTLFKYQICWFFFAMLINK
ncbi:hypothetical protein Q3G72_022914 [Acer saccharum]|nr:hypothetical protein Q3G72_022914 [Acer saccharum]